MKKYLLFLLFSLGIIVNACATPSNTMSISPSATDATVIAASDENSRNNEVSGKYNVHTHTDISQTANTLNVGDAAAGSKTITANNADANKPFLRYNDTLDNWILSTNGVASSVVLSGTGITFEGLTDDAFNTSFSITDPTAARTITVPNNSGIMPLGTAANTLFFTTTAATNVTLPTSGTIAAYSDTRFATGSFTRDLTAASGNVSYTGVGFTPKKIIFIAVKGGTDIMSWSVTDFLIGQNGTLDQFAYDTVAISLFSASDGQQAVLLSYDSNGFTLSWTKTNSPSGTGNIIYLAFR